MFGVKKKIKNILTFLIKEKNIEYILNYRN